MGASSLSVDTVRGAEWAATILTDSHGISRVYAEDLYSKAEIEAQYERATERTQLILDAFADGMNRKMTEVSRQLAQI